MTKSRVLTEEELARMAELLKINKRLYDITIADINAALDNKLNVRVIDCDKEEQLKDAAAKLSNYVGSRTARSKPARSRVLYEVQSLNGDFIEVVTSTYKEYVESLKAAANYSSMSNEAKADFDALYQAQVMKRKSDGSTVIIVTFASREDADKFMDNLRKQGCKITLRKLSPQECKELYEDLEPAEVSTPRFRR